jgi:hypothetical protein
VLVALAERGQRDGQRNDASERCSPDTSINARDE